jgi:hypothetical protein
VARGRAARRRIGGGGSIPAASQARARLIASLAAVACAAGTGVALWLQADEQKWLVLGLAGFATALLALALLVGSTTLVPWPLVLLGAAYTVDLAGGDVDQWAPVYAGAFLAIAELSYWSLELRGRAEDVERLTERRAGLIVALAIGAVALGGVMLAATSLRLGSGVALDAVGVLAAIGVLFVVTLVARRA